MISRLLNKQVSRVLMAGLLVLVSTASASSEQGPAAAGRSVPMQAEGEQQAQASEVIEALVVLASKGERESVDGRLAEVAPILKAHFGQQFNVFRLSPTSPTRGRVRQGERDGIRMSLIGNYFLRTIFHGVQKEEGKPDMVRLEIRLTQSVRDGERTREVTILGPLRLSLPRDKYFPIGGPVVDGETMILFLRVTR